MNNAQSEKDKKVYDTPCVYQITLQGSITSTLIQSIDDFQIREYQGSKIYLTGLLPDQSALMGLLNTLHEIHYGILSVNVLSGQ